MSATITKPSLAEIILDALSDAYWSRVANVEECKACPKQPTEICPEHEADAAAAQDYEEARKRISEAASDTEVLALLAGERVA